MAWKYKRGGVWWIGTRANGTLICKSTGERDEEAAAKKLASLESMEAAHRAGKLNRELFDALTGAHIEAVRLFESLDTWLAETTNPHTRGNYKAFADQFKAAMPHNPTLLDVTHEEVRTFLASVRATKRASTANLRLKCAKAFFARFHGALRKDPTEGIPAFSRESGLDTREPFTPEQIRRVMAIASPFWRCASALAFYTGIRLNNVATLKAGQLQGGRLVVAHTIKTGASVSVKLPQAVVSMMRDAIPPDSGPDDYIWPEEAKLPVSNLSSQFATLLIKAGLRKERAKTGTSNKGRRTVYTLSFHSLRHSLISALANAGANQQTVKAIVGHATDRINDAYTHLGQGTLDKAVSLLPDVTI